MVTMKLSHAAVVTLLVCYCLCTVAQEQHQQKTYTVHMDKSFMPTSFDDHFQWYESSLKSVSSSADMLYTYDNVIHGFSTRLMAEEAELLEGFLCALNYSSRRIKALTKRNFKCKSGKRYRVEDLNYPSFAVPLQTASGKVGGSSAPTVVRYKRTLTNVGTPATYTVSVTSETPAVKISVKPKSLKFSRKHEKKSYTVTFTASSMPSGTISSARLRWSGGKHIVSSPIAFSWT
ncbi:hypothetical protein RJ639_047872 [Escallonia herrerae]|uniref:Uncharacterized protein n=1 Tax=Escallonia herrerae TaxID=1293975 RepID=A0AA88VMW0_9ASTE|nr:hypothetical protein RJ639_011662 [Escallonia herrerae]KAK3020744.1 hypothetical protein RJ639_047872 [Escallonia herrerae]